MLPLPEPAAETLSVPVCGVEATKFAPADRSEVIATWQLAPAPEQSPDQPPNEEPLAAEAFRVTLAPFA
jgi:hypothetical protein